MGTGFFYPKRNPPFSRRELKKHRTNVDLLPADILPFCPHEKINVKNGASVHTSAIDRAWSKEKEGRKGRKGRLLANEMNTLCTPPHS